VLLCDYSIYRFLFKNTLIFKFGEQVVAYCYIPKNRRLKNQTLCLGKKKRKEERVYQVITLEGSNFSMHNLSLSFSYLGVYMEWLNLRINEYNGCECHCSAKTVETRRGIERDLAVGGFVYHLINCYKFRPF
jgi:hypothetical protein